MGADKVGFLVCEVMGQGVRSALIVSMLRGLIEKEIASAGDAGSFLTGLNLGMSHLFVESGLEIQASAFYGVVDLASSEVQVSMAGQLCPVVVFEDGVRQLVPPEEASGPALGTLSEAEYGSVNAPLTGLRRMICFSSGVQKACNADGEEFGLTRLIETIERGGNLVKVMERVAQDVVKFSVTDEYRKAICLLGWDLTA